MKKIIIEYNHLIIKIHLSQSNTSIIDSYRVDNISDMVSILKIIRDKCDKSYAIHSRSIISMINEWRVYNLLYSLNIKKDRTGTIDLNRNQKMYRKIVYGILSIFYF